MHVKIEPSKLDGNYTLTLSHHPYNSCAILLPLKQICFVFVSCVQRVVEGSGVGSAGCVVHVDVHGE